MKIALLAATIAATTIAAGSAQAGIVVTYENPGVTNTTANFDVVGVETFDSRPTGTGGFATSFGGNGAISGVYSSGLQINSGDKYGGQGASNYAVTFNSTGYSLDLTNTANSAGVTYFGYYLPALDRGNMLELWSGDTKVFSFSPSTVLAAIGGNSAYFGKPDAPYQGQNSIEPYAFVNFFGTEGTTFDRIVFFESPTVGGYESDNHTVGFYKTITGNGVPEPTTWALMISGFGLVGSALRRRQQTLAPQVA